MPKPQFESSIERSNRNAKAQKMIDELAKNPRLKRRSMELLENFDEGLSKYGSLTPKQYQILEEMYQQYEG